MIQFNILTLFPELVENFFKYSILNRAVKKGILKYNIIDFRKFSEDKHKTVDDTPFGGGYGMVIKPEPIIKALSSLTNKNGKFLLLSAKGELFNQYKAKEYVKEREITLICGRYEGIDERVKYYADEEISTGDYVLMGGEVAAFTIIESVSRLLPGVVGKIESTEDESFSGNFLEYAQYTRPREFMGYKVPEVLLSGNHKEIQQWRIENRISNTISSRFDLIKNREKPLKNNEVEIIKKNLKDNDFYIALLHYPVYNKNGEIVATATTNMDIHDISRVAKTYNIKKYFIVTPIKEQQEYITRVVNHWKEGYGFTYNRNRATALNVIELSESFEHCLESIKAECENELIVVGTSAKSSCNNLITVKALESALKDKSLLLVFGTGWGLTEDIMDRFDYMLEPLYGRDDFNHLSVRSAISIILDRILGF